ncbi:4'-phosphopantetheinyl transferase family protein [Luteimonas sp. SDU101]|uniref:4'-phosphopantetheinyl transferase family protein n=1 Tax=Luteimonas sp. SDU101 TaxID=3422593 RepID=UPI003EC05D54
MPHTDHSLAIGPVRCAWFPYRRGEPAEPQARRWLAQALAAPEAALGLQRGVHGRPHLDPAQAGHDANWSHSGERLLVALAQGARVGADIEWLRPRPNAMTLARRFFTAAEAEALSALPHDQAERWFVRLWCAKEAVLKAHGRGIAFGLERLEFSPEGEGWRLSACDPALGLPEEWRLHAFSPEPDYLATLAWRAMPAGVPAQGR